MNWMFLYFRANKLIRIKVWEQEKPLLWPFYTHSNCAAASSSIWSSRSILCKGLWLLNDSDGNWKTNLFTILLDGNLEKSVLCRSKCWKCALLHQHLHDRVQMEFWPSSCHYEVTSLLKIWILDGHRITTREIRRFRVQQNLAKKLIENCNFQMQNWRVRYFEKSVQFKWGGINRSTLKMAHLCPQLIP